MPFAALRIAASIAYLDAVELGGQRGEVPRLHLVFAQLDALHVLHLQKRTTALLRNFI